MAATPPAQITGSPETPSTPLHGAAYERFNPRRATRSSSRIAARDLRSTPDASLHKDSNSASVTTPKSSRKSSAASSGLHSPQLTPKNKSTRRVHVISPPSPDILSSSWKQPPPSKTHLQPFESSSTTISDGMLPTPVKTPKKKMVPKVNGTARALFQDPTNLASDLADIEPSPRRNRKTKRYNGYSLESFSAEADVPRGQIQIFTDSRDRVPQVDKRKANPFVETTMDNQTSSSRKVAGTVKRRKVSAGKKLDPQVEEAIHKDEGMVYVFRGKKVYRRFNDDDDEEEEISAEDAEDLGLLEHSPRGSHMIPLKTLTRRSIKPTRLFQTEAEKRARELEKEEEALTDIEETTDGSGDQSGSPSEKSPAKAGRSLRSAAKASPHSDDGSAVRSGKKGSPFDTWPRVKSGTRAASSSTTKGRKRSAAEAVDDSVEVPTTK